MEKRELERELEGTRSCALTKRECTDENRGEAVWESV